MNLQKAFPIQPGESVALAGAGGKTALMFALARSIPGPVVVTTTTHLGAWQVPQADDHLILAPGEDLLEKLSMVSEKLLITGPAGSDDRLAALTPRQLEDLRRYCKTQALPLLMEADGARQKSLKAPADHEPAIPDWVDQVIVVAGLGGLNQLLSETTVHRPARFAVLSGLKLGEPITDDALVQVLGSPDGGLKNIPARAKRTLFLNQAETSHLQSQAGWIASELASQFPRIVIGALQNPGEDGPVLSVRCKVAGVILAAGGSKRLGQPKQVLDWQGRPFIAQVVLNALAAGLAPLIVVTGAKAELVREAVAGLPVEIVHNPDWQEGQSTSLRAGVAVLPENCQGVMFLMSDLPQVSPVMIRSVLETFFTHQLPIAAPRILGRRTNPVLFGRETFELLDTIQGDQGGRAIFDRYSAAWVDWVDERCRLDVDKKDAYATLRRAYIPDPELGTGFHDFLTDLGD